MGNAKIELSQKFSVLNKNLQKFFLLAFSGLFALLVSVGFKISYSLIVTLFFGLSTILGALIFVQLGRRKTYSELEILGAGIAFGTILPALIGLLVRTYLGIPTVTGFVVLLLLAIVSLAPIAPTKNIAISPSPQVLAAILPLGAGAAFACFNYLTYLFIAICICGIILVARFDWVENGTQLLFMYWYF